MCAIQYGRNTCFSVTFSRNRSNVTHCAVLLSTISIPGRVSSVITMIMTLIIIIVVIMYSKLCQKGHLNKEENIILFTLRKAINIFKYFSIHCSPNSERSHCFLWKVPTWTVLGSSPRVRANRPATMCQSHDTALVEHVNWAANVDGCVHCMRGGDVDCL